MKEEYTKISTLLEKSLSKVFRFGIYGLVLIFIGILMIASDNYFENDISNLIFTFGITLSLLGFILLALMIYIGPLRTKKIIEDNSEVLDVLQGT